MGEEHESSSSGVFENISKLEKAIENFSHQVASVGESIGRTGTRIENAAKAFESAHFKERDLETEVRTLERHVGDVDTELREDRTERQTHSRFLVSLIITALCVLIAQVVGISRIWHLSELTTVRLKVE